MKYVVVTSQVTYVPKNYLALFEELVKEKNNLPVAIVLLDNIDKSLLKGIIGTFFLGAWRICALLIANTFLSIFSIFDRRVLLAKAMNIPVIRCKSANDQDFVDWVKSQQLDLVINARTRCIYRKAILEAPKLGCINIHHGILPHYRGTMCDLYALSEGMPAGFSIHRMNKKIDDGEIIKKVEVSKKEKNYPQHLYRSSKIEGITLVQFVGEISKSRLLPAGEENISSNCIYTRNPGIGKIIEMKRKGIKL